MKAADCRNFTIAGHSGCGKTTLTEMMLFKAKAIDRRGSVEQKNSTSDYTPEEQEKQCSLTAAALHMDWKGKNLFFTDTPGYAEFVGEVMSCMRAADAAMVVVDSVDGPQIGTARSWKMARDRQIPGIGVISRLDRERADYAGTLEKMRNNHGRNKVLPVTWPIGAESELKKVVNVLFDKDIPADIAAEVEEVRGLWMDAIAETDEELMMRYLDGETLSDEEIAQGMKAAIANRSVIPVLAISTAKDIGVDELMDFIAEYFPSPLNRTVAYADGSEDKVADDGPAVGLVFKSINDPFTGQLSLVRVRSGVFRADSEVQNLTRGGKERFGQLLLLNGKQQSSAAEVGPGGIFAIAKLKDTHFGDTLTVGGNRELPPIAYPDPVMSYALAAAKTGEDDKMMTALNKLVECDPTIRVSRHPETHEMLLSGMGDQHLALVLKRLRELYKVEALLSTPKVPYRETIAAVGEHAYRHKKQSGGAGQFAEVHLRIEPKEGEYEFVNAIVGGAIPKNFIPAVEKGVQEMLEEGPLVGCPVERVRVTVFDGKYHPVDSNEMAFKIASRQAFKEAMNKARPVLLEPIMTLHVHVPDSDMGNITGDLNHKRGRIIGMEVEEGLNVVNAEVPMAELPKYATELRSMTQGRGFFEMEFARYEEVPSHIAGEIIAKHQAEVSEE
ncbi:MAG: elongation factor G [Lentisphaeria bacterium]|nr:elongation factor G [Lentisphaeria bacterium]